MFNHISWTDYLIVVAISLAVYYVFVGLRYYLGDLKNLLAGKHKPGLRAARFSEGRADGKAYMNDNFRAETTPFEETTEDDFVIIENLISRLKKLIGEIPVTRRTPDELKGHLQPVLQEYPSVRNSVFRSSVNELIVSEWEKYSVVVLTEEEVDLMW